MNPQRIVVIGASAGGVEALQQLVGPLARDFAAPVLIVLHTAPHQQSLLPRILSASGPLPATIALSGDALEPGRIAIAPADHHLTVDENRLHVTRGPRDHDYRPSIDVLFRSAAYHHGPRVVGIVLSGRLSDGTAGLSAIKRLGGIALVQDPDEARHSSMPRSAIRGADVDRVLPASQMASMLDTLLDEPPPDEPLDAAALRKALEPELAGAVAYPVPDKRRLN